MGFDSLVNTYGKVELLILIKINFQEEKNMTSKEYKSLEKVLSEGIVNAKKAKEEFINAGKTYDTTQRHLLESKAWNHQGYAEGINQVLASIGFEHKDMELLAKEITY